MNGRMRALLAFALVTATLASAGTTAPQARADEELYGASMIFPVVGENYYSDTFGAPRSGGRTHEGVDIMADKMIPVVAVASGTVGWMHDEQGGDCCAMALNHDDGWESWYIHLNNDTPGTDDGLGWGFAPGIESGVHVEAGQLIGYVGDSGNAEEVHSHLHFELHMPDGTVVNPTPQVDAAIRITAPLDSPNHDAFRDDDNSVHEANINKIAAVGITKGCNPPVNDMYCPEREITRGEMAAFLRRNLDLPDTETDYFTDDTGSVFHADIDALAEAGIGFGCTETEYCPDQPLLRDELAELFVRAYGFEAPNGTDFFVDDDGNQFEASINAMAANEITLGCNPPDNTEYCPARPLTRAEMASFFARALGL
ncbi:MAG: M23 family metallopeptidase [Acidimicrobiia bacterium]